MKQYRNIEIDKLRLSDEAIAVLKDGKLNNRLISEFIAHADFPKLLSAMEIYIDRKVLPQMNTMNAMYKFAEQTIKENAEVPENDEMIAFLQQSVVDEDEYLRYRISERFNMVMKSLFDNHKKDKLPPEQADMLADMKEQVQTYLDAQKTEPGPRTPHAADRQDCCRTEKRRKRHGLSRYHDFLQPCRRGGIAIGIAAGRARGRAPL